MNGHTERISFTVSDRIALNRTKRVAAPPVGVRQFAVRKVAELIPQGRSGAEFAPEERQGEAR